MFDVIIQLVMDIFQLAMKTVPNGAEHPFFGMFYYFVGAAIVVQFFSKIRGAKERERQRQYVNTRLEALTRAFKIEEVEDEKGNVEWVSLTLKETEAKLQQLEGELANKQDKPII